MNESKKITNAILNNLSNVTINQIKKNTGFRTDSLYKEKDFKILNVIEFECEELENEDIIDFIEFNYDIQINNHTGKLILMDFLHMIFNKSVDNLYGYWFSNYQSIVDIYANEFDTIYKFELPKQYLILSDLDDDGFLIVSDTPKSKCKFTIVNN